MEHLAKGQTLFMHRSEGERRTRNLLTANQWITVRQVRVCKQKKTCKSREKSKNSDSQGNVTDDDGEKWHRVRDGKSNLCVASCISCRLHERYRQRDERVSKNLIREQSREPGISCCRCCCSCCRSYLANHQSSAYDTCISLALQQSVLDEDDQFPYP